MLAAFLMLVATGRNAAAAGRGDAAVAVAVARACVRHAGAQPERARGWLARIRRAAFWPELRLGVERDLGTREQIDLTDRSRYGAYTVDELRIEARATWRLDRLVFDPEEVRVSREAVRLADLRQELALTAVRLFYERRRLELDQSMEVEVSPREQALRAVRIDEIGAALEALCGPPPESEERAGAR
jgi:hypothetical protein